MADCRIELFVTTDGYDPVCIIGEIGHVNASSNTGPRPDVDLDMSSRDAYANLILLCRNCHRKVDTLQDAYTKETLLEIKSSHEAWVRTALPERGFSSLRWRSLRLQGEVPFDPATIPQALSPDQESGETVINVSGIEAGWPSVQQRLRNQIQGVIAETDPLSARIAVFPLAPTSACVFTGFLLTNRLNVRAFQYHRDDSSWIWPSGQVPLTMPTIKQTVQSGSPSAEVFILFELSSLIDASELQDNIGGDQAVFRCLISNPSTSWLRSKSQLDELARKSREVFESAASLYPRSQRWHIIYAGPAPGGIVVGQQLNPTMIPVVQLYEFQRPKHISSITITPKDSSLSRWTGS